MPFALTVLRLDMPNTANSLLAAETLLEKRIGSPFANIGLDALPSQALKYGDTSAESGTSFDPPPLDA